LDLRPKFQIGQRVHIKDHSLGYYVAPVQALCKLRIILRVTFYNRNIACYRVAALTDNTPPFTENIPISGNNTDIRRWWWTEEYLEEASSRLPLTLFRPKLGSKVGFHG